MIYINLYTAYPIDYLLQGLFSSSFIFSLLTVIPVIMVTSRLLFQTVPKNINSLTKFLYSQEYKMLWSIHMLELRPSRTAAENKTADRRRKKGKILYE